MNSACKPISHSPTNKGMNRKHRAKCGKAYGVKYHQERHDRMYHVEEINYD